MPSDVLTRSAIVASARTFLKVPWVHQGRTRAGVDCVGLVVAIADDLGIVPPNVVIPPYNRRPDASLLSYFEKYMVRINPRDVGNGSVIVFSYGGTPYHAGIVASVHAGSLIHAYASRRKVVYDYLESQVFTRKIHRAFDFKGVVHG